MRFRYRTMTSLGNYLKKEREAQNLSVREIADRTKISQRYLLFIESDDYDQLPQGPYVKGYISAYAHQVCGDANQALKLYERDHQPPPEQSDLKGGPGSARIDAAAGAIEPQSSNGERRSVWRAGLSVGLSMVHSLRQALPGNGSRSDPTLSDQGAPSPSATRLKAIWSTAAAAAARLKSSLPSADSVAAGLKAILSAADNSREWTIKNRRRLLAIGLHSGIAAICIAFLVFAGIGFYHLFIYEENPPAAMNARGVEQAQSKPSDIGEVAAQAPAPRPGGQRTTTAPNKSAPASPARTAAGRKLADKVPPPPPASQAMESGDNRIAASPAYSGAQASPKTVTTASVELIKASVCTEIEDRMPVNVGAGFAWTTPRIYVWSLLSAKRPPAKVHHIYYHEGQKISDVVLRVGSAHWRTWSFQTLGEERFRGPWRVEITSDDGQVLRRLHFDVD